MKVGIISMQRVPNYGSFLQAYCLKNVLTNIGHEVIFIDYKEGEPVVPFERKELYKFRLFNLPFITRLNDLVKYYILNKKEFVYRYRLFYLKELGVTYKKNYNTNVDCVIIGSDEVFNCLQKGFNVGFSPMLFGNDIESKKIISYAASFGNATFEDLDEYGLTEKLSTYFEKFSDISVRDLNSRNNIYKITGKTVEINVDPVFLFDIPIPNIVGLKDPYILLYTYKSRVYTSEEKKTILAFCRRNGKKLISVGNAQGWVDQQISAAPREMLAYIKKADFVITDTFHGTVFSIKLNKRFATYVREDNKQKLMDLLVRLKKTERQIANFDELQSMYECMIDYTKTNLIIDEERQRSFDYLNKCLEL